MIPSSDRERYSHPASEIQEILLRLRTHAGYPLTLLEFSAQAAILDGDGTLWISRPPMSPIDMSVQVSSLSSDGVWSPEPVPFEEDRVQLSAIFEARTDIRAVIQAHSNALDSFGLCSMVPNTRTIDPVFQVCGAPAFIEYAMTPDALNKLLYSSFKEPTAKCALTAGHGVICTGLTLRDAFAVFETLDFCARLILRAQRVAIPASLTEEQLAYHQFRSSVMAYEEDVFAFRSISSLEKRLRLEMVTCVKKGIQQSLMSATSGSISARLSSNSILITPTGVDRGEMDLQDILLVREDPITNAFTLVHWYQERSALVPSRAIRSHFSIYNRHPQVQGIISAHPLNVSALCAIQSGLETRVMPPPYARLCRVLPVDYGSVLDSDIMAQAFDQTEQDRPSSVLIANDGAITVGESVSGALERLELLESVCSIAIDAHSLGLTAYSMFLPAASRRKEE